MYLLLAAMQVESQYDQFVFIHPNSTSSPCWSEKTYTYTLHIYIYTHVINTYCVHTHIYMYVCTYSMILARNVTPPFEPWHKRLERAALVPLWVEISEPQSSDGHSKPSNFCCYLTKIRMSEGLSLLRNHRWRATPLLPMPNVSRPAINMP